MARGSLTDGVPFLLAVPFWEGSGLRFTEHGLLSFYSPCLHFELSCCLTELCRFSFSIGSPCMEKQVEQVRGGSPASLRGSRLWVPLAPVCCWLDPGLGAPPGTVVWHEQNHYRRGCGNTWFFSFSLPTLIIPQLTWWFLTLPYCLELSKKYSHMSPHRILLIVALGGGWGETNSILQVMKPGKERNFLKGKQLENSRTGTSARLFCLSVPHSFTLSWKCKDWRRQVSPLQKA